MLGMQARAWGDPRRARWRVGRTAQRSRFRTVFSWPHLRHRTTTDSSAVISTSGFL